jgi:hypothetical protein
MHARVKQFQTFFKIDYNGARAPARRTVACGTRGVGRRNAHAIQKLAPLGRTFQSAFKKRDFPIKSTPLDSFAKNYRNSSLENSPYLWPSVESEYDLPLCNFCIPRSNARKRQHQCQRSAHQCQGTGVSVALHFEQSLLCKRRKDILVQSGLPVVKPINMACA